MDHSQGLLSLMQWVQVVSTIWRYLLLILQPSALHIGGNRPRSKILSGQHNKSNAGTEEIQKKVENLWQKSRPLFQASHHQ
jgi:hypothetical protein